MALTKVAFIDLTKNFYDKHAIYALASVMRLSSVKTYYINETNFFKALKKITQIQPDLLLYSVFSTNTRLYREFDREIKKRIKIKSIAGGPACTFDYRAFKDSSIDALCIGEGELALSEFLKNGFSARKNIMPSWGEFPKEFFPLAELDNLPFPDRDIVYKNDRFLKQMGSKQFLSGRGCPYDCTYCHNHVFNKIFKGCGPLIRKKSVGYLIMEIKEVGKKYRLDQAIFQDDTFIIDKDWFIEFCFYFKKEIDIPYICNIRADLVDEDVVRALSETGCNCVNWSIESGDDFLRNKVLKRDMTQEQILYTASLLNKYKIRHRIGNIIGLPGENFSQMRKTMELNIKARPSLALANIFVPFSGLELTDYALKNKFLSEENLSRLPGDFFTESILFIPPKQNLEIQKLVCLFPVMIRHPALYRNRTIFKLLFKLPKFMLSLMYDIYFPFLMSRLYRIKASFSERMYMLRLYRHTKGS